MRLRPRFISARAGTKTHLVRFPLELERTKCILGYRLMRENKEAAMLNELVLGRALYVRPRKKNDGQRTTSRISESTRGAWQWIMSRP